MYLHRKNKGFTLIELLVTIAIIGILSAIVLTSLSSSKNKTKDSAIKNGVTQMEKLLAIDYSSDGSFCNLQTQNSSTRWVSSSGPASCESRFSGENATEAAKICKSIYDNANTFTGGYKVSFYVIDCTNTFSVSVYLNNNNWYCSGYSSNAYHKGEYSTYSGSPGCLFNP